MIRKVIGNLVLGQACLFGGLLICIALKPKGLRTNDGISYYGTFTRTVVPYAFALLGAAVIVLQLVLGARLLNWTGGDAWVAAFLVTQFLSGVFCAIYVLPKHGWLILGQLAFQLSFGALLVRTARLLLPQTVAPVTQVS